MAKKTRFAVFDVYGPVTSEGIAALRGGKTAQSMSLMHAHHNVWTRMDGTEEFILKTTNYGATYKVQSAKNGKTYLFVEQR